MNSYFFAFVIDIVLALLIVNSSSHSKAKSGVYLLLMANNLFAILYIITACPLILFGKYFVELNLRCMEFCEIVILVYIITRKKLCVNYVENRIRKYDIIKIFSAIIVCFLIRVTAEEVSSYGDSAAYFQHMILMMKGNYGARFVLKELHTVSELVDINLRNMPNGIYAPFENNIYQMHANGTWAIFLALAGKMFGLSKHMIGGNYLFILSFLNFAYSIEDISIKTKNRFVFIILFALSPLLLYLGKTPLAEIAILFLVSVAVLNILSGKQSLFAAIMAGTALGGMSLVHVTGIIYIPLSMLILFVAGIRNIEKKDFFWKVNLMQGGIFAISVWYLYGVAPYYTENQYASVAYYLHVNTITVFILIDCIIGIALLINYLVFYRNLRLITSLINGLFKHYRIMFMIMIGIIVGFTCYYGYFLGFSDKFLLDEEDYANSTWKIRNTYVNTGFVALSYLTMTNIFRATGIMGGIYFLLIPFIKKKMSELSQIFYFATILIMFFFTVLNRWDIPINYYASRYIAPVLVPLIILTVTMNVKSNILASVMISIALLFNGQYIPSMLTCATHVGQYEILEDALDMIDEDAVVLMQMKPDTIASILLSDLRILNDNYCYSLDDWKEVAAKYENNKKIYIVSGGDIRPYYEELDCACIYKKVYISQYSLGHGENGTYGKISGRYEIGLHIYEFTGGNKE